MVSFAAIPLTHQTNNKMIPTFKNLLDASAYFHSEEVCREHLERIRWNGNPVCPHCATTAVPYRLKDGKTFRCSDKDCRADFTVRVGTIFENSKLPLRKWFLAIHIATAHKKGISSLQLHRDLGITQKTAWYVLHRMREMLTDVQPELLSGTIQIDETYVGPNFKNLHKSKRAKIKSKPGRGASLKTMVFGILQEDGTVLNKVVQNTKTDTLLPIMDAAVEKGSTIVTDGYHVYKRLAANYNHVVVDHTKDIYVTSEGLHTNTIEGYWSQLKRGIYGIYHQVSPKHLHRYCDEFAYRYNTRKKKDSERFNHSLEKASGKRLTYKRLINK